MPSVTRLTSDLQGAKTRIVVFTSTLNYSVCLGIVRISRRIPDARWLILCHSPPRRPGRLVRNQWLNLRRNGWRWIPYQVADAWERCVGWRLDSSDPDGPGQEYTPQGLAGRRHVSIRHVADINGAEAAEFVRDFEPDLGLSIAAPILRPRVFSIPRLGTLNLHKGRLPDYRGMPPAFWEMWNDESSVGCSVHLVDERLDHGDIVAETSVTRERYSTLRGLQIRLDETGAELMASAVENMLKGDAEPRSQAAGGKTYRKPVLSRVAQLERRLGRSQPVAESAARRVVKGGTGLAAYALWVGGARAFLSGRATVLLYHRVSDDARDNLTVGIEQFDRQMAIVRRYCSPVSLETLLNGDAPARSARPMVAVTFDDGYLDNYENAVPVLLRHRLPAAFFVSTRIIGTDSPFPHDIARGNEPIAKMSWDHLRAMHDEGFYIGSHACTHIDCAAEPEEVVRYELAQSRQDLERELGIDRPIFAYPYGGREHMTDDRLELVREAGYRACLSAYGGSNVGRIDPFNVLRKGISWEFSDRAFLFECTGLR